jgi:hypothetical protein
MFSKCFTPMSAHISASSFIRAKMIERGGVRVCGGGETRGKKTFLSFEIVEHINITIETVASRGKLGMELMLA